MPRSLLALLMFLLVFPAYAESPFNGGFHGSGLHGGGLHGGGFHAFHRRGVRAHVFFNGYLCGYNCGWGFDSWDYDYGYGYGSGYGSGSNDGYERSHGYGAGYGYGSGAGNAASISNGLTGAYVPDPVGADIPPLIIPTNCWVRRAAYDPSGAYFGQTLVNLCRHPDRVSMTGLKVRAKTPDTVSGVPQLPPIDRKTP